MAKFFLGMDYGTGGAKACIINEEADTVSYAFREYPILTDHPGWSEHYAELYWEIACELIRECIEKAHIQPGDIKCVGTSSAMPCLVMIDQNGKPINHAYNLMDRRATTQAQWVKDHIGEEKVFRLTGNRIDDHPVLINLMWERENRPKDFVRIYKALTIDGFIRYRLTGRSTMHYSAGWSYGIAYDMRKHRFDESLLKIMQIDPDILPDITACEEIVGEVTKAASASCGLQEGTLVAGGQLDCNAGWLGAGAIYEGDIQMNLGTCGNFGIIHKDTEFVRDMLVSSYTIDSKNTNITVPTTTTGGQSLRYIRDNFAQAERALEGIIDLSAYDMLTMQAKKVKPGSDGLIVLPYLMGERSPIWDVYARGVIFGLSLSHTKGHLIRATMEAVAYALYDSFRIIRDTGKKINYPIVLNEGGARSRLWREIITDVFNVPTVVVESRIGAPFGDAVLAAVAEGTFPDYSVTRQKARYIEPMEPDEDRHEIYMKYFDLYKKIYQHIKEDFVRLNELRNMTSI